MWYSPHTARRLLNRGDLIMSPDRRQLEIENTRRALEKINQYIVDGYEVRISGNILIIASINGEDKLKCALRLPEQ